DQMIAAAIIFQIVITAEAGDMHKVAARAQPRGAAHPGENDIGAPGGDLAPEGEAGTQVEEAPESEFADPDTGSAQGLRAVGISPDQHPLRLAGALQRRREPGEKTLRTAVRRTGDRLQHPAGHFISASNSPATASQLHPP